jgi:hypothetical protein
VHIALLSCLIHAVMVYVCSLGTKTTLSTCVTSEFVTSEFCMVVISVQHLLQNMLKITENLKVKLFVDNSLLTLEFKVFPPP